MRIMDGNFTGGKKMNARGVLDQLWAQAPCMEWKKVMPSLAHVWAHLLSLPAQTSFNTTAKNKWWSGSILRKAEQHAQMWKMCSHEGPLCTALKTRGQNKMYPFPLGITRISTKLCDWLSDPQHFLKVGHSTLRLQTWHWIFHGWVAVALWRMALGTLCSHIKQLSQRMLQLPRK